MTHVDAALVAPLERRFGAPAEWRTSVRLTTHDLEVLRYGGSGRAHDVTFAVVDGEGRVAVIRKPRFPPGAWRIPSGGINPGETFEAGVLREALEEIGLEIELTGYPLVARAEFLLEGGGRMSWTTHVVSARPAGGTALDPRDRVEIAGARWMTPAELTGAVARVLRAGPGNLFRYRADLHDRVAGLLHEESARTV